MLVEPVGAWLGIAMKYSNYVGLQTPVPYFIFAMSWLARMDVFVYHGSLLTQASCDCELEQPGSSSSTFTLILWGFYMAQETCIRLSFAVERLLVQATLLNVKL